MNLRKFLTLALMVLTLLTMTACGNQALEAETPASENIPTTVSDTEPTVTTTMAEITAKTAITSVTTMVTTEEVIAESTIINYYVEAYTSHTGDSRLLLFTEIENTGNVPLAFSPGTYEFTDEDGRLIEIYDDIRWNPMVADPGERVYFYTSQIVDPTFVDKFYKYELNYNAVEAKSESIRYDVTEVTLRGDEYSGLNAIGRVENNTDEAGELVTVAIILFDSSDKPIGILNDYIDDFAPGQKTTFDTFSSYYVNGLSWASVDHYEALAFPFQY